MSRLTIFWTGLFLGASGTLASFEVYQKAVMRKRKGKAADIHTVESYHNDTDGGAPQNENDRSSDWSENTRHLLSTHLSPLQQEMVRFGLPDRSFVEVSTLQPEMPPATASDPEDTALPHSDEDSIRSVDDKEKQMKGNQGGTQEEKRVRKEEEKYGGATKMKIASSHSAAAASSLLLIHPNLRFTTEYCASINFERRIPNWVLEYFPVVLSRPQERFVSIAFSGEEKEEGGLKNDPEKIGKKVSSTRSPHLTSSSAYSVSCLSTNAKTTDTNTSASSSMEAHPNREHSHFFSDPFLPGFFRSTTSDYQNRELQPEHLHGHLSRGHLAPAGSHKLKTQAILDETFNLGLNVIPQDSCCNGSDWLRVETLSRKVFTSLQERMFKKDKSKNVMKTKEGTNGTGSIPNDGSCISSSPTVPPPGPGMYVVSGPLFLPSPIMMREHGDGKRKRNKGDVYPSYSSLPLLERFFGPSSSSSNIFSSFASSALSWTKTTEGPQEVRYPIIGHHHVAVPSHLFKVIMTVEEEEIIKEKEPEIKHKKKKQTTTTTAKSSRAHHSSAVVGEKNDALDEDQKNSNSNSSLLSFGIAAFVIPNVPVLQRRPLTDYQVPLEVIEFLSGLEFFPKLRSGGGGGGGRTKKTTTTTKSERGEVTSVEKESEKYFDVAVAGEKQHEGQDPPLFVEMNAPSALVTAMGKGKDGLFASNIHQQRVKIFPLCGGSETKIRSETKSKNQKSTSIATAAGGGDFPFQQCDEMTEGKWEKMYREKAQERAAHHRQ